MDKLPPRKRTSSATSDTTNTTLPPPPPIPQQSETSRFKSSSKSSCSSAHNQSSYIQRENLPEQMQYLLDYKAREKDFLKTLQNTITSDCNTILKKESELYKSKFAAKQTSMSKSIKTSSSAANLTSDNTKSNKYSDVALDLSFLSQHGLLGVSSSTSNKTSSSDEFAANRTNTNEQAPNAKKRNSSSSALDVHSNKSDGDSLKDECEQFIMPLLNRTSSTISAVLAAYDAFEQLNNLHNLVDQMLSLEEQNYQMRKYIRDVKMLCELKKLQNKDYSNDLLNETGDMYDNELDLNNHSGLLNTILAAGNTASSKRNSSKRRERSKSVFCDEIAKESMKASATPRRQSAYTSDAKAKTSKWTKVKAAFKWEKANVQEAFEEQSKVSANQLKPINKEVARYLRVPAPVPLNSTSADSFLSSSIPPTSANVSSASSMDEIHQATEERRDSSKSDSRFETQSNNQEEENRRSRSLDSDMMLSQMSIPNAKSKTPWKKVKNIIQTHRGSFKSKARSRSLKSTNSAGKDSRDVSPSDHVYDDLDLLTTGSNQSIQQKLSSSNILLSPSSSSTTANSQKCSSGPNSPGVLLPSGIGLSPFISEDEIKPKLTPTKPIRKSKIGSGFESLPEGVTIDITSASQRNINRPTPSPLNLSSKMDSSDAEFADFSYSPIVLSKAQAKILANKKYLTSAGNSSVPSSPSRHSEFFAEFESEDMSSGDFSEPTTPSRKNSDRLYYQAQQEEINERYLELREKLNKEFEAKRQEWEKMRLSCSSSSSSAYQLLQSNDLLQSSKSIPPKLLEENLSADFKKKLHKWRNKKSDSSIAVVKDNLSSPPAKGEKIDWHLWKTGHIKLEGQGLSPLPDQKSLPEDFQKKLEQWKKMKDTNSVPTYLPENQNSLRRSSAKFGIGNKSLGDVVKKSKDDSKIEREKVRPERDKVNKGHHDKDKIEKLSKLRAIVAEPKIKEIEVQTSAGVMKFEGISRKFTRKLYEWEKAKGIGPESSTFAFLYPGYTALAKGSKSKENRSHEPSPTLGRSMSLDSISPIQSMPSVSHQPSCLSLNNMDELRDTENSAANRARKISSNMELNHTQMFGEDQIQGFSDDDRIMNAQNVQRRLEKCTYKQHSFEIDDCFLDSDNKLSSISRQNAQTIEEFGKTAEILESIGSKPVDNIRNALTVLKDLEGSIPELESRLERLNTPGKAAMNRVRSFVVQLIEQCQKLNEDEACCQELLDERTEAIETNLHELQKNILLVCKYAQIIPSTSTLPMINVTSEDDKIRKLSVGNALLGHNKKSETNRKTLQKNESMEKCQQIESKTSQSVFESNAVPSKPQIPGISEYINDTNRPKISRNSSNGSRKKSRLRKMGSRQNSKTESESTDDEVVNNNEVTQRRLKRRLSRNKKSIDEDKFETNMHDEIIMPSIHTHSNENTLTKGGEDVLYVLKIKPGQPIEQSEICGGQKDVASKFLISPTETSIHLMNSSSKENVSCDQQNVFVKTKRKIFTIVGRQQSETGSDSGIGPVLISKDLDSSTTTEVPETEDSCRDSVSVNSLPPSAGIKIKHPSAMEIRTKDEGCTIKPIPSPPKEPCKSIKLMIAKYNQKLESDRTSRSPISSGTCTPSSVRSPILDRKIVRAQTNRYQENIEKIVKSASAGNIVPTKSLTKVEISIENDGTVNVGRISRSFSLENVSDTMYGNEVAAHNFAPLARDSLKNINRSNEDIDLSKVECKEPTKEHLFKKHKEKPNNLNVSKHGALRKIELKHKAEHPWRRSSSTSEATEYSLEKLQNAPDKSDNTIPKITRKLENKATTPTEKSHPLSAELWHPLIPGAQRNLIELENERPKTPLNERALKLARAKEEFLSEIPSRSPSFRESSDATESTQRFSQTSFDSEFSIENSTLAKCASVGMIDMGSNVTLEDQPDTVNLDDNERYVSLPRSISRSGKFTSKLGFATLASKFRKVKMRKESRDDVTPKGGAISALCRQSLVLDVTNSGKSGSAKTPAAKEKLTASASDPTGSKHEPTVGIVKSKSSNVGSFGTLFKSKDKNRDRRKDPKENENEKLVKSKSSDLPHSSKGR